MMQSANMQNSNYSENSNILYARNSNFQGTYDAFYNRSNDVVQTSPEQDSSTIRYRAGITNDTPYGGGSNLPEDTSVEANTGHGTSNPQARRLSSTEQSIQQVDASTPTKHKSGSKWKLWKSTPSQNDTNQTIQESDEVKSMQSQIFELRLEQQKMKSQIRDKETRERNITQALDHTTQEKQGLEKRLTDVQTRHSEYISRQRIEYQDAIDNAIQEKQALEKRSTDLQTQHIERINRQRIEHQGAIDKKDDEIRVIRRQLEEKSQEIVKRDKSTTQMKETHLKTIEKLHKDYASKLQKLREEHEEAIRQESKQRADLEANHELDRNTHIRQKEEDIKKLKQAQATRITGLKEQNEKKLKEMEKKGESMRAFIKQLKIQHSTAIEDQEQSHRTTLEDQQKAYEMREAETVRDHQQVKSNLISEHREKERKLIAESAKRIQNLNEELADLSEALLARDNDTWTAPPLSMVAVRKDPDEHITGDFEQVAELVSSLVELEWKNPRSLWTDDLLARLDPGCGQRKLKQNVLRNIIWEALEEHIFESPFRLFGDEGRTLETQWSERYGADNQLDHDKYSWPLPGVATERWRYITLRECRYALSMPLPSAYDPRAKLKKGFKDNRIALVEKIQSSLGEVAHLQTTHEEAIKRLANRMSNLWLQFGMNRCRIVISLQDSNLAALMYTSTSVREKQTKKPLLLNIAPSLGRYGNVDGFKMETYAIIGKRPGDTMRLAWTETSQSATSPLAPPYDDQAT